MGSDLYRVRATDKSERSVMLEVKVVHPDANHLPEDPSFALMLLLDDAPGTSVLAQEVSVDDAMDDVWLQKYVRGFVSSVQVTIESGTAGYGDDESPPDDETEAEEEARLERRRASWLTGRYAISVTDPAWVEHLAVGKEWDSRAFAAGYDYDDCAPIRPGRVDPDAASPEGFLWIPRELWADMNPPAGTPRLVPIPAYGVGAYRAIEPRTGTFSAADLRALDRQAVWVCGAASWEKPSVGVLVLDGTSISFVSGGSGGFGTIGFGESFAGIIGQAELKKGARLGKRTSYSQVFSSLKPTLESATREGDAITFGLRLAPGSVLPEGVDIGLGFYLMFAPLLKPGWNIELEDSPLSRAIEREVLRLLPDHSGPTLPELWQLVPKLASGFVGRFEVVRPPPDDRSLDELSEADARRLLDGAWPEAKVKVAPTDPAFVAHLAGAITPRPVELHHGTAEPWEGPPAKA
jgi:hypothetical protein